MTRAAEVARTFIADETLSRDVESLAAAVDSTTVPYVPVAQVLGALREGREMSLADLAARIDLRTAKDALVRLQDLGLVTVAPGEGGDRVALTPEGVLAAECQVDGS